MMGAILSAGQQRVLPPLMPVYMTFACTIINFVTCYDISFHMFSVSINDNFKVKMWKKLTIFKS